MKKYLYPIVVIVAIVSLIVNVLAYYRYSSSRPVITVNGVPITRKQFQDRVDYLYARPLLSSMIWQSIVIQAAEKQNCVPSDSDVDAAVAQLQRSTPQVVENARRTDPDLTVFKEDLKSNLALRNLRMVGITVTPAEIQSFYNAHKTQFQLPAQTETIMVVAKNVEDAETAQRLLQNGVATSVIAQQQGLSVVGMNVKLTTALPNYVGEAALAMKSGDVKIIPIGNVYGILKAKTVNQQGIPPLSAISDQVREACALSKAPGEVDVLKKLRAEAIINADEVKYADAIPDDPSGGADAGQ